jgi:hypothetical protein
MFRPLVGSGRGAIAQTPTKQPALRLSRTKNLHFAKATFPGFSASVFQFAFLQAQQLTKPQMAKSMMARAIRGGVKVDFLLADAWFGTKAPTILRPLKILETEP